MLPEHLDGLFETILKIIVMESEIFEKINLTTRYLKKWEKDTNDQITKNHISTIINDVEDIGKMLAIYLLSTDDVFNLLKKIKSKK